MGGALAQVTGPDPPHGGDPPPTVLLVDDRRENLVAMEAVLASLPCRLVSVTSGSAALRHLLKEDVALILLDVQMPELDGFRTAEYIKGRPRTRAIPIIFVTAISTEPHHVFAGYEAGAVDYLLKPYDPDVLRAKVKVFLDLHEAGRALRRSEQLLRATFADAPIGMARLDDASRVQGANRALLAVLGRVTEDVVGRPFADLVHPEDRRALADARAAVLDGGRERADLELRLVGRGGEAVLAELSLSAARDEHGGVQAVLAQVQDIRERRRAAQAREQLAAEQAARREAEAFAARQRAVRSITDAALAALGLEDLLGELLARLTEAVGVPRAAVVLGGTGGRDARAYGYDAGSRELRDVDAGAPLGEGVPAAQDVELLAGGDVLGRLVVGGGDRAELGEDAQQLLALAADRVALAIERVRVFEREHALAEELQRSLLPERLPDVPGLELAARYLPGGGGSRIGGDWYDVVPGPGGRTTLLIGDVAGRGVAAATAMGQLRSAMRAYALDGEGPAATLERVNRYLHALGWDSFATALALELDPLGGTLTWSTAGHPAPVVLEPDGVPRRLPARPAVPLGVLDQPAYGESRTELAPGTTLLVFTDGLVERRQEDLGTSLERLERTVAEDPCASAEELCERIAATVGADADDDAAWVVVRAREALGPALDLDLPPNSAALAALRAGLRRWLTEAGAVEEEVAEVTLAVNEAAQNAMEHAHGFGPQLVGVGLRREAGAVEVRVRDHGTWQDTESEDRGRGLDLIRAFADEVEVGRWTGGTEVRLRRRLAVADDGANGSG